MVPHVPLIDIYRDMGKVLTSQQGLSIFRISTEVRAELPADMPSHI